MKNLISSKAATFANQLKKLNPSLSMSDCFRYAWDYLRHHKDALLLTFKTVKGEIKKRLVSSDWSKFQAPTGNGRAKKEGLHLFADLAKFETGLPCLISTYQIISLA